APPGVVDREGEHAVQAIDDSRTVLFPAVHDDLGVRRRAETVAAGFEIGPQIAMVVDLTVEDDPDRPVFVGHRLPAAGQVDDGQTPMAERDPLVVVEAVAVGAPMGDGLVHAAYGVAHRGLQWRVETEGSGDSAHHAAPWYASR